MGGVMERDTLESVLPDGSSVRWAAEMFDYGNHLGLAADVTLPDGRRVRHAVRGLATVPDIVTELHGGMVQWFADWMARNG
jgi:hypothetical protein